VRVSVIVPLRTGGCVHRERAWSWCRAWWKSHFPEWEIVTGSDAFEGPWRKAVAVDGAVRQSTGEVLVVADADVVCDGVAAAVRAVAAGAPWVVPHRDVVRFNEAATAEILAGSSPTAVLAGGGRALARPAYRGKPGGGLVVVPRSTWEAAPMDPRFADHGAEDECWGYAMATLAGDAVRLEAPLFHLWHPPQDRRARPRHGGENGALRHRYVRAHRRPAEMRAIVAEASSIALHP
jgi:hypothetical protein